ncbi:FecR domain-containing protein [Thermoplasmatota archaeon]
MVKKTEKKKLNSDVKVKSKTVKKTDVKKNTSKEDISSKTITSKKGRNKFLFIVPIIIVICIIGFVWFFVLSPSVVEAQLIIESGDVQVKHEGGSWSSAENGMLLYQSDIVKTGDNTSSSIILFESSIIRLDSNTEVMLKEIIQEAGKTSVTIQQDAGRTWNTVLKVSGIDDYEVQTPTTVASVRGTSFDVYIQLDNITVGVGRGVVVISKIISGNVLDTIELKMNEAVSIYGDIDQILKTKAFLKDGWVLKNQEEDEGFKSDVKTELYKRIDPYIDDIKERWDVTDEEFDVLVTGYVNGNFDLPPDTPEWIKDLMELS